MQRAQVTLALENDFPGRARKAVAVDMDSGPKGSESSLGRDHVKIFTFSTGQNWGPKLPSKAQASQVWSVVKASAGAPALSISSSAWTKPQKLTFPPSMHPLIFPLGMRCSGYPLQCPALHSGPLVPAQQCPFVRRPQSTLASQYRLPHSLEPHCLPQSLLTWGLVPNQRAQKLLFWAQVESSRKTMVQCFRPLQLL